MKTKVNKTKIPDSNVGIYDQKSTESYPLYPETDDIYIKLRKEEELDPEDISTEKELKKSDLMVRGNKKTYDEERSGSDLDIPGSELDDAQEIVGSEDEENNYYSLGGDDHNDLEEDQDEL